MTVRASRSYPDSERGFSFSLCFVDLSGIPPFTTFVTPSALLFLSCMFVIFTAFSDSLANDFCLKASLCRCCSSALAMASLRSSSSLDSRGIRCSPSYLSCSAARANASRRSSSSRARISSPFRYFSLSLWFPVCSPPTIFFKTWSFVERLCGSSSPDSSSPSSTSSSAETSSRILSPCPSSCLSSWSSRRYS